MLKPGLYEYVIDDMGWHNGKIVLDVKETEKSFILKLISSTIRYDAPQIDDMFRKSNRVTIRKDRSNHAMTFIPGDDGWFCLYPYRVGIPYAFNFVGTNNAKRGENNGKM